MATSKFSSRRLGVFRASHFDNQVIFDWLAEIGFGPARPEKEVVSDVPVFD